MKGEIFVYGARLKTCAVVKKSMPSVLSMTVGAGAVEVNVVPLLGEKVGVSTVSAPTTGGTNTVSTKSADTVIVTKPAPTSTMVAIASPSESVDDGNPANSARVGSLEVNITRVPL